MKIVFSTYDDLHNPYYGGGGAIVVHEVAKRLAKSNEVTVYTGKYPGCKDKVIDGVAYKRVGTTFRHPLISQVAFSVLLHFTLIKEQFDLWIESFTPPFSVSLLPVLTRKPVIGLVQNLSGKEMSEKYGIPFHFVERLGLRFYSYLVALTPQGKKKILQLTSRAHVEVIPNALNLLHWESTQAVVNEPYILYIGRIDIRQKGLDILLSAYKTIARSTVQKLVIAGDGSPSDMKRFHKLVARHKLADSVIVLGRVDAKKKWSLINNADFVVLPSRFESQGLTFLEVMARSRPLVCFAIDDLSWISPRQAVKIQPFSKDRLAQTMQDLASSPSRRERIARRMQAHPNRYVRTWDDAIASYEQLITSVTTRP